MTSSNYKQLFSRINNANHEVKNLYEEYVDAEKRIAELEREKAGLLEQLANNAVEIKRLSEIIQDMEDAKAGSVDKNGDPQGHRIDSYKDAVEESNFTATADIEKRLSNG